MYSKGKSKHVLTTDTSSSSDKAFQLKPHLSSSVSSDSSNRSKQTHSEAIEEATKWLSETNRFINNSGKHEKAITEADEWLNSTLKKLNSQSSSSMSVSKNIYNTSSVTSNVISTDYASLHSSSQPIACSTTSHLVSSKSTDYYFSPVVNSYCTGLTDKSATTKDIRLDPSSSSYSFSSHCIRPSASFGPSSSSTPQCATTSSSNNYTNNLSKVHNLATGFVPPKLSSHKSAAAAADSISFTPNNMVTIRYPECKSGVLESPVYENITFMSSLDCRNATAHIMSPCTGINFSCFAWFLRLTHFRYHVDFEPRINTPVSMIATLVKIHACDFD